MMTFKLILILAIAATSFFSLSGCSSVLPHEEESLESKWESFNSVKQSFDEIQTNETTKEELSHLGFNPYETANIKILSYLDIIERFIPNASITLEDLDPNVVSCIADKVKCLAYEINIGRTDKDRYGNAFMDVFAFKRQTKVTGWQFKSLLIIHNDKVVYKLWSGSPNINKQYFSDHPLGPLQDSSGSLKSATNKAVSF
jgi:hypothetical protein